MTLGSLPAASTRCIYRIIPTPLSQFFFLTHVSHVAPLYCLSLLIHVGVCIGIRVGVRIGVGVRIRVRVGL